MLKKIKNCIFRLIYIFVIIYLLIFMPTLWREKPLVVISGSMEPNLKIGGIIYYHEKNYEDYEVGDVLVYRLNNDIISHRIYDITENGIITKGDANNTYDNFLVLENQILGEGTDWCIPYMGYYAEFIYRNKILLYMLVMIVGLNIIIETKKEGVKNEKIDKS